MPVQYQIPPWVRGADVVGKKLQAYAIGLQAAQAQARLAIERQQLQHQANQMAQQAQMEQMRLQIAQQEQERKRAHDDQQLEVLKEYHRQQGDLEQQKLGQAEEKIKAVAAMTAHKYHAQEAVQNDYQQLIQQGFEPEKAIVRATLMHATELGLPMAGIGGLAKDALAMNKAPFVPGDIRGFNVRDAQGNIVPNMIGLPNASGTGMLTRDRSDLPKTMQADPAKWAAILAKKDQLGLTDEQVADYTKLFKAATKEKLKSIGETPTEPGPPVAPPPTFLEKIFGKKKSAEATSPDSLGPAGPMPTPPNASEAQDFGIPVGTEIKGFKYLGGDPHNQKNWDSQIQEEGELLPGEELTYPDYAQLPGEEA